MTGLLGDDGDRSDRAQLILITGLTLAVLFVAVVLLLNTVIYTENLATRGVDAGGTEAAEFRAGTAADVGGILDRENRNADSGIEDVTAGVNAYANGTRDHRLRDGVVSDVSLDESTAVDGWYVAQDREADGTYRSLTADDEYAGADDGNWTLVENATRVRGYRLTLPVDSVHELGENETPESDAFAVRVDEAESSESWTLYAYVENGAEDVTVSVDGESLAAQSRTDEHGVDVVDVDLTDGTVTGERWPGLVWAAGIEDGTSRYHVSYENGDRANGTYELTVRADTDTDVLGDDERFGTDHDDTGDSPYALSAVYSVELTVSHHTPDLRYEDRVRVAPGERDD